MAPPESEQRRLLVVAGLGYLLYLFYLVQILHFDMFRSDVRSYWLQSFEWRSPYSNWWVPGYSLVIAAVRGLTLGLLPPLAVMLPIAALAYLTAVAAVYRIARQVESGYAFELGLLFALYPLVGLTYSAYPMSDIGAIALFLLAVLEMQRQRWRRFTAWAAAALIFHKVMWFFVPPLLVTVFFQHPRARRVVPFAVVPLLAWIVGGAFKFHSALWFVRFNYETHTVLKQGLPVLGGLVQTLEMGSPLKLMKGAVIVTTLLAALVTAFLSARRKLWPGLWISGVVAFLIAAVNSYEIWIAMRYSKLMVVAWCLLSAGVLRRRWGVVASVLAIALLMATNLGYGWYLAHYFGAAASR